MKFSIFDNLHTLVLHVLDSVAKNILISGCQSNPEYCLAVFAKWTLLTEMLIFSYNKIQ